MDTIKIGKKGQVTIPRRVLEAAGLSAETQVIIESESDGSIRLRHIRSRCTAIHSIAEFEAENRVETDLADRAEKAIGTRN